MVINAIRTVIIYILLVVAVRIMGKRQLSEMQPTELVVTLLIADMASVPMQDTGIPLLSGLIPIFVLLALELLLSSGMMKLPFLSKLISGNPVIIIKDGELDKTALARLRMTVEDLFETLRTQGYFDIDEIAYAIAEPSGSVSVLLKPAYRAIQCGDMSVNTKDNGIPTVVVSDGKICRWALPLCNRSERQIKCILQKGGYALNNVLLMTLDKNGKYAVVEKDKKRGKVKRQ